MILVMILTISKMAKTRNAITQAVNGNIFDNNNKEILAAMVRSVLADYRDSYFNLIDDRLKNILYDGNTTLEQHLNSIVGAIPKFGTIIGVDPDGSLSSYTVNGIISSASSIDKGADASVIEVNFSESIANRRLIPVITFTHNEWWKTDDFTMMSIRRISSTKINLIVREIKGDTQNINIEIIAI